MKQDNIKLFAAIATMTGMVIGAGFLGIPYVVAKSGFLIGLIWMIIISGMLLLVNLSMAEITLSSKTIHHIPGYASKYLGRKTKIFVFLASIFGFYAALIAYLLGEGDSLSFIFSSSLKFSFIAGLGFWILMAILTFRGIRSFKKIQPIAVLLVFAVTLIFGIVNINQLDFSFISQSNITNLFLPFGVILFAFLGVSSIPEMKRVLKGNLKLMKKAIIFGSLIPLIVYVLFTIIVLGVNGDVSQVATLSLGKIVTLLGIFTMFTAFLALSLALQDTFRFDFDFTQRKAWLLTIIIPLVCYIAIKVYNLAGFVKVLSLGGAISGGLLGIAILLIHEHLRDKKVERKPEFRVRLPLLIKIIFIILFIVGILYEFI